MQTGEIVMVEWSNTTINYQFNQQILYFHVSDFTQLYFPAKSLWWMSKWKISRM